MPNVKREKKPLKFNTDEVARLVFTSLARDFRSTYSSPEMFKRSELLLKNGDIKRFREYEIWPHFGLRPDLFKVSYQMASLFKKYRFAADVYTDQELIEQSQDKWIADQLELAEPKFQRTVTKMVLQRARKIASDILGDFPDVDVFSLGGKFGAKSNIGCPLHLASLDYKMLEGRAFTSNSESIKWFVKHVLPLDPLLESLVKSTILESERNGGLSIESLILKLVPKSWKTYRVISPLALIALFYSYAYEALVKDKLAEYGLDMSTLQHEHKKLVKKNSVTRRNCTVDLKRASDSILFEHCCYVLPRKWLTKLKPCLSRKVKFEGAETEMSTLSILPMGNAATFPIETLIFYCITKALGDLLKIPGKYSVYGDDIIYPRRLHPYFVDIASDLGFKLNLEKTFVSAKFRESCGSDCYHGIDVRPFFFPGESSLLTKSQYQAFLYKVINGLLRRWAPGEIPQTIRTLLILLHGLGPIYRVPPLYPDESGVKVMDPLDVPLGLWYLNWSGIVITWHVGYQMYEYNFVHLRQKLGKRFVRQVEPHLWDYLRTRAVDCIDEADTGLDRCITKLWYSTRYKTRKPFRRPALHPIRISGEYNQETGKTSGNLSWVVSKRTRHYGTKSARRKKITYLHRLTTPDKKSVTINRTRSKIFYWTEAEESKWLETL